MRREALEAATSRIGMDLRDSGLADMFNHGVESMQRPPASERDRTEWISFSAVTEYIKRTADYNEVEKEVSYILEIDKLSDPKVWQPLLKDFDPGFVYENNQKIRQILLFLPRIVQLLGRDYDALYSTADSGADLSIQTVVLTDEGGSLSSPQRLIELLASIQQIYGVIAFCEDLPGETIAVVGMDSGSEKSFDFLGLARLVHELRETLQLVYNMITFHKQNISIKNLQVASEALTVVSKINKLESAKAISVEEANRLKHSLFSGLERFSATGAYTPEMRAAAPSPALSMRPQPRLLTGPVEQLVRSARSGSETNTEDEQGVADESIDYPRRKYTREDIDAVLAMLENENNEIVSEDKKTTPHKTVNPRRRVVKPKT